MTVLLGLFILVVGVIGGVFLTFWLLNETKTEIDPISFEQTFEMLSDVLEKQAEADKKLDNLSKLCFETGQGLDKLVSDIGNMSQKLNKLDLISEKTNSNGVEIKETGVLFVSEIGDLKEDLKAYFDGLKLQVEDGN